MYIFLPLAVFTQEENENLEWGTVGLPEDDLALLAPARQAFVQEKQRTVSHGGVSVEELIVPLVQIERRGE